VVLGVGVSAELLKHGAKGYKVISVPKSVVPPHLLKVLEVVIVAGVPQTGNVTIAIKARGWLERVCHVCSITRKPYSDCPTQLISQE